MNKIYIMKIQTGQRNITIHLISYNMHEFHDINVIQSVDIEILAHMDQLANSSWSIFPVYFMRRKTKIQKK